MIYPSLLLFRYCIGTVVAMLLNFILPEDVPTSEAKEMDVTPAKELDVSEGPKAKDVDEDV